MLYKVRAKILQYYVEVGEEAETYHQTLVIKEEDIDRIQQTYNTSYNIFLKKSMVLWKEYAGEEGYNDRGTSIIEIDSLDDIEQLT